MVNWQGGAQGAVAGAGSGAALGTMFGPGIGTGIGAGIGALSGFLLNQGAKGNNPYAGAPQVAPNMQNYMPNTTGVQNSLDALQQFAQQPGAGVNTTAQDDSRLQQQALANMLLGSANGTAGPSAAQLQMQQGLEQALMQGRGVAQQVAQQTANPIAALQAGGGSQALLQRQNLADSSILRAQEQLNARDQLASALNSMRAGDINTQGQQLQAGLGNRQIDMQALSAILGGQSDIMRAQQQGGANYANANLSAEQLAQQNYIAGQQTDMANRRQMLSTILQTAGAVGSAYNMANRGGAGPGQFETPTGAMSGGDINASYGGGTFQEVAGSRTGVGGWR